MFKNIVNKIYGQNPYLGFESLQPTELRQINGRLFEYFIKSIRPQIILELGSWQGETAIKMAQILEKHNLQDSVIICVDTWLGSPEIWLNKEDKEKGFESLKIKNGFPTVYQTFLSNVINSNQQDKIIPFPQTTENAAVIFQKLNLKFDLIYLDASREYEAVSRDLQAYGQLLSTQGIIFGSGYPKWEGVSKAVNNFAEKLKLKVYSKGGKYLLVKPEQNLAGLENVGLKQEEIKLQQTEKEIIEWGLIARQKGKEEEALKYFEQLMKAHPKKVSGYVEAGKSLRALQRLEEAKERFEQALERKPNNLEALMGLGEIAALEGELESALERFERAIEHHPNHLNAYEQASIQLRDLKRFIEAERIADLGMSQLKEGQQSVALLREKAFALVGQLKLDKASKILQKLAKLRGTIGLFTQAAIVLTAQKKFAEAIELLDKNLSLLKSIDSNWTSAWRVRSVVLYSKQIYEGNLEIIKTEKNRQSLELRPQKTLLTFPLEEFDPAKISQTKPSLFSDRLINNTSVNINQGFDDLEGLLEKEKSILYEDGSFKSPIYAKTERRILTVPNAYVPLENTETMVFSLDGYYLSELFPITTNNPIVFLRESIIDSKRNILSMAFITVSTLPNNYCHTLCDIIPSLLMYKNLGLNCPIVFPAISPKISKIFMEILEVSPENIIPQDSSHNILFEIGILFRKISLDKEIVSFYQKITDKIVAKTLVRISQSKRIYISRRRTSGRPLLNEEQVENLLFSLGFSICYMEEYTFEEQVAIMHNCEIVVAPHGAGLTNILFCQLGITVIELLADKYPASCFYRMAVLCGHKYYPILGSLTEEKDWQDYHDFYQNFRWKIDLTKLQRVLEKIIF